jgi:hypothetical protein
MITSSTWLVKGSCLYCGLRLMAINGSNIEFSDEADNVKPFVIPAAV